MSEAHERALQAAAEDYRQAASAAEQARDALMAAIRAAYADGERQSDILRATGHVWTREYLRVVLGLVRRKND